MTLHEALELGGAPSIPTEQYASQLQRLAAAFPKDLSESCPAESTGCALGELGPAGASLGTSLAHRQAPGEPTTECLASAAGCTGSGALPLVSTLKPVNRTLVVLLGNARGGEETWESLYTNLLDPQSADLALAFGDTAQPLGGIRCEPSSSPAAWRQP